jgi:outer membrane murein-binding lipoprotein Lpp
MSGPRIYTEAWERLRVAAKELEEKENEAREAEEQPRAVHVAPEEPKPRRKPRLLLIAAVLLAGLTLLVGGLWIDSQTRLVHHSGEVAELKAQIDLLQEKVRKAEEERKRLEAENGTLSTHFEQKAAELADMEQELDALRFQREKAPARPKRVQPKTGDVLTRTPAAPEHPVVRTPAGPEPDKPVKTNPEPPVEPGVKVYKID